ncbi:rpl22 [Symbiodinium sp. CCMP2592]|nr:rpl22 [Symbiodinium sp. CCMP2592]
MEPDQVVPGEREIPPIEPEQVGPEVESGFSEKTSMSEDAASATEIEVAEVVARMESARPGIVRAVQAWRALSGLGKVFRSGARRSMAPKSFPAHRIDEFWSHSWHGRKWLKAWTAFYMKNTTAATIAATLASTILCVVFVCRWVPQFRFQESPPYPRNPPWCLLTGLVFYCLFFLCWRPGGHIFLDILCIDQEDDDLKVAALLSIGAFLKRSDALVILWDPSWSQRLWCVFELATFLHSRPDKQHAKLIIRPTALGPVFLSLPAGLSFVLVASSFSPGDPQVDQDFVIPTLGILGFLGFYVSVGVIRGYYRSVEELQSSLSKFNISDTKCFCCSEEDHSGLVCDRKIVYRCIMSWFGSLENFEAQVRTEVLERLLGQLSLQVFTYRQCVATCLPLLWSTFDSFAEEFIYRVYVQSPGVGAYAWVYKVLRKFVRGVAWTFGALPVLFCVATKISFLLRRRCCGMCGEILVNVFILLVTLSIFVGFLVLERWCWEPQFDFVPDGNARYDLFPGSCVFGFGMLSLATVIFLCIGPCNLAGHTLQRAFSVFSVSPQAEPVAGI